ncbi:uncharacterized protein LOC122302335 isoform X3 [Carya illinoinensis]|uniref:uncharacterized protein LOC122302335 isoform X3 n=1 Tax=Carya illinoinensis TaxID=32201 RepID=UPI001C720C5D|nr:uncharacterized protein LOC122302335 isoform X3 [Carya illinoinensis]
MIGVPVEGLLRKYPVRAEKHFGPSARNNFQILADHAVIKISKTFCFPANSQESRRRRRRRRRTIRFTAIIPLGPAESMACPIQGMESIVATVSGYHGLERFNLIKLISYAGANYVGVLSGSTTHLVCLKFQGKKYDFAKRLNKVIVNHQWVEECIKQGKRVPEHPYILNSGEEVGPLLLEIPLVTVGVSTNNCRVLADKLNVCDNSGKQAVDLACEVSGLSTRTESCLLDKHEEYGFYSSEHLDNEKRKIFNGNGRNILPGPSCKGRRLVKKNVCMDMLESANVDSNQECYPIIVHISYSNVSALPMCLDGTQNAHMQKIGVTFDEQLCNQRGLRNEGREASKDSNLFVKHPSTALEGTSQDGCTNVDDLSEGIKDESQIEHVTRLPTSTELSCVICWTDFSSTRGFLPCGHRFCYSCIENWADHMASRRKISTCPLCKAIFTRITKVEDAATTDQKIYSQTIPCAPSDLDIFVLSDQETHSFGAQSPFAPTCSTCCCREPEDLLISCHLCQTRRIHSYCLDPPLLPWTCMHCNDLRMIYHHT